MADNSNTEQLTPLDLLMPRTYVSGLLTFQTTESTPSVLQALQQGLNDISKQIPWLTGRVFPTTLPQGQLPTLGIRRTANAAPPELIDSGSISASYEALSAKGMYPEGIPPSVWPCLASSEDAFALNGAPVFAASVFRFSDNQGVGVCVCVHHNVVDGTGFAWLLRLWAGRITGSGSGTSFPTPWGRIGRLSEALAPEIQANSVSPLECLFASHPEYSRSPPELPNEFPSSTSKLFRIPMTRVIALKQLLEDRMATGPTTNTLISALLWQAVTRARTHRNPALADKASRLVTAVDGRKRIDQKFSTPDNPYLGNLVLYATAKLPVKDLGTSSNEDFVQCLADACRSITRSSSQIGRQHIAEVFSLVHRMDNYKDVSVGWDLFNSIDFTISSWSDLPLYDLDFGKGLGRPDFVRVPYTEADGVGFILPRRRETVVAGVSDEVVDVVVMLRRDDMAVLEKDEQWKTLTS